MRGRNSASRGLGGVGLVIDGGHTVGASAPLQGDIQERARRTVHRNSVSEDDEAQLLDMLGL